MPDVDRFTPRQQIRADYREGVISYRDARIGLMRLGYTEDEVEALIGQEPKGASPGSGAK